ncbi:MAG: RNA polymerase sigma factor SigW [Verrucomicrobia bacterium]|nr:MAG: RNA polymerase sigma factor SigW [Verrucomicrobiota bacterium]
MMGKLKESLAALFAVSDEQAMRRVQMHDDERAFAHLVKKWQGPVRRLCIRMLGDEHRGEDLAQESFARVFAQRKHYRPDGKFGTWLWRIALNLCYDELRRRQRWKQVSLDSTDSETLGLLESFAEPQIAPDQALVNQERAELVRRALLSLPEIYRAVLVLRHYENLKFREIAAVLGLPEGTVKSRMAEALTQMSQLLKPKVAAEPPGPQKNSNRMKESLIV